MAASYDGTRARIGRRRRNEARLSQSGGTPGSTLDPHELVTFTCECGRVRCTDSVEMVASDFATIAHAGGFALVAPNHAANSETIIARSTGGYLLISPSSVAPGRMEL